MKVFLLVTTNRGDKSYTIFSREAAAQARAIYEQKKGASAVIYLKNVEGTADDDN